MVINLKPYISLPFNSESLEYTIGISTNRSLIDQKRNVIRILPGYQTVVKVIPQLVGTSLKFNEMDVSSRKCKLPHETEGLKLITDYTRIGCEFECAVSKTISLCKCMPWYYPNNYTDTPVCDAYGGHCFEEILSEETNYKECPEQCIEDCEGIPMTVVTTYIPINPKDICKEGNFIHQQLIQSSRQHFAFENYKALVTGGGTIPDLQSSLTNGSLCFQFIEKFVAIVSVESPTNTITKSARDVRVTFIDQLGTIGGTLGLFTGMSILSMVEIAFFAFTFFTTWYKFDIKDFNTFIKKKIEQGLRAGTGHTKSNEALGKKEEIQEIKQDLKEKEMKIDALKKENELMKRLLTPLLPPDQQHYLLESMEEKYDNPQTGNQSRDNIETGFEQIDLKENKVIFL